MRSYQELENVMFADWTEEEVAKASIEGKYPSNPDTQLRNLKIVLPKIERRYTEEKYAYDEMVGMNPHEPYLKEWAQDLKTMKDLIDRGIALGDTKDLWHAADAMCPKCEQPLTGTEITICSKCKRR